MKSSDQRGSDPLGRPTVTLDEDVAAKLEGEAERTGVPPEEIVNGTLRRALADVHTHRAAQPFIVHARDLGVPKIDLTCSSRALAILDELLDIHRP
jgi:hypothetical protein